MSEADEGGSLHTGIRPAPTVLGNENQQSEQVKKEMLEQSNEARALVPIAKTVSDFIAKERDDIKEFHSYLKSLLVRKGGKQPKKEDIEAEFRAREIYLGMLDRFESKIQGRVTTLQSKVIKKDDEAN